MERIKYEYNNRDAVMQDIADGGKLIVEDVLIDLVGGIPQTCYFGVVERGEEPPDYEAYYNGMQEVITDG